MPVYLDRQHGRFTAPIPRGQLTLSTSSLFCYTVTLTVAPMRILAWLPCALISAGIGAGLLVGVSPAGWRAANPAAIEDDLDIAAPGGKPVLGLDLATALAVLHGPSISVALIDGGGLAWARVWGDASVSTRYQAASLSKLVTAVAALRLVEQGRLALDRAVNADLGIWHVPDSELTRGHPVTLRGLLSMTGGIGVPGYLGYVPGTPLPNLLQILNGEAPANSPPVRVAYVPGTRFAYSGGGGYEVVQALIEAATHLPFNEALQDLVLRPAGMEHSLFAQPLPAEFSADAARGHYDDGRELPGGWRVMPELAAGGLWSTATDLARLLIEVGRAPPQRLPQRAEPIDQSEHCARHAVATSDRLLRSRRSGCRVGIEPSSDEARAEHRISELHADISADRPRDCRADRIG
jgi:CubicO group peptidase (beta-lactamase class C family)